MKKKSQNENQGTLNIPQIKKPIQLITQLGKIAKTQQSCTYFFISTIDRKITLVQVDHGNKKLLYSYSYISTDDIVTAVYFDPSNLILSLGTLNGHIMKVLIQANKLVFKQYFHKQEKQSCNQTIILLYSRKQFMIIWSLNNTVTIIKQSTKQIVERVRLQYNIACVASFKNPYSSAILGCVAFDRGYPPLIFDCWQPSQIKATISKSQQIFKRQQSSQQQIVAIAQTLHDQEQQFMVVCASKSKKQQHIIVVYTLVRDRNQYIYYLQPLYRFQVEANVLHLSIKDGIVFVSMFSSIMCFNINTRTKQLHIMQNQKKAMDIICGFVLQKLPNSVKFIVNKGFNFWSPEIYKQQQVLKLKVRERRLHHR